MATNLDTGGSVTFGAPGRDHVRISRAIEASAALPGLFPPVAIDGEHYVDGALNKTLHASVALEQGVELLLCVNPLVPFDASRARPRQGRLTVEKLNQGGLPLVLSQTFRAIIHSRMRVGMERYRRQYPNADIVLFEPDREDSDMFFANVFSYRQTEAALRRRVPQDAAQPDRPRAGSRARCSPSTASRCAATGSPTTTATCSMRWRTRGRCTRDPASATSARQPATSRTRSTSSSAGSRTRAEPAASAAPAGVRASATARGSRPGDPPAGGRFATADPRLYTACRALQRRAGSPWRKRNDRAAPASASSRRASTSSTGSASPTSRPPTSPTR